LPGFNDCDRRASNGCESDPTTDEGNCGDCDTTCNAGDVCNNGVCLTP
jgi:hypothetical protein